MALNHTKMSTADREAVEDFLLHIARSEYPARRLAKYGALKYHSSKRHSEGVANQKKVKPFVNQFDYVDV